MEDLKTINRTVLEFFFIKQVIHIKDHGVTENLTGLGDIFMKMGLHMKDSGKTQRLRVKENIIWMEVFRKVFGMTTIKMVLVLNNGKMVTNMKGLIEMG